MDIGAPVAAQAGESFMAPQPGTAEYDAAMVTKAAGLSIQQVGSGGVVNVGDPAALPPADPLVVPPVVERPAWLPEKFATAEDMAKSYAELERTRGVTPPVVAPPVTDPNVPPAVPAGLDIASYSAEFATSGALSEASYESLAKSGIDREMVNAYIEGQVVQAERYDNTGYDLAGGKTQFSAMTAWAKASMQPAAIVAFNAAVGSGNVEQMKLAVAGLKAQYTAANGSPPSGLLAGQSSGVTASAGDSFQSRAEMTKAMGDDRYAVDPAYRKAVMAKLGRTTAF